MIRFDGNCVKDEFQTAFERPIETLTDGELWWLVKFAKHVRGRCRNNSAFNNYMNRNFPSASFNSIEKPRDDGEGTYTGLEIKGKGK